MKQPELSDCDNSRNKLLNLDDVLTHLLRQITDPYKITHCSVHLNQALGKVLAADVVSNIDVPPNDNSAVDGYALSVDEYSDKPMVISQRIPAGASTSSLTKTTTARIFTGAPIPINADCVIMQEDAEEIEPGKSVVFSSTPKQFQNVRPKGQDIQSGQTILKKGQRLTPQRLGLVASIGLEKVEVYQTLKVAIFSTGDELVEPGSPVKEGQIYNSNRYMLKGLLQSIGFDVLDFGVVPDNLNSTRDTLKLACEQGDVVITTGGASVGEEDYVKDAIKSMGELDLWRVAIKPGKPFMFGQINKTPILGLPGNPGAVFVTFSILARPFLLAYQGASDTKPRVYYSRLNFDITKPGKRREFLRVKQDNDGKLSRHPNQSSGMLSSASWADGFAVIMENTSPKKDDIVKFIPFSGLFSMSV